MAVGRVFVPNKTLVSSPKFPTGCFPLPSSQQTRRRALLSQVTKVQHSFSQIDYSFLRQIDYFFSLPKLFLHSLQLILSFAKAKMCALSDPLHSTPHHLSHITKYLEFQAMKWLQEETKQIRRWIPNLSMLSIYNLFLVEIFIYYFCTYFTRIFC